MPDVVTLRLEHTFSDAMDRLRAMGWDPPVPGSSRDRFDVVSRHVVARRDGEPVGMVRITPGGRSVLATWAGRPLPLASAPQLVELTRGVVARDLRRLGIYRLLMLETMLRIARLGGTVALAAIEPDFPGRPFLASIGFAHIGSPLVLRDAPRSGVFAQPIVVAVSDHLRAEWRRAWQRQVDSLRANLWTVDSDLETTVEVAAPARPSPALATA